ncbi:hypothetical protein FGG08_001121 [Glutinoglossum americanum]|uniref:C2H2-type domain-containing protein n=1 Tax=Glutinoglossum americanum TaxID=1670608 RepID=A0A9P8L5L2_9PEZI|nr:hypothetical protein FGG08_001121 [Glutinoglossum americanum]
MPWNMKTPLLVLWGVCWMFFGATPPLSDSSLSGLTDVGYDPVMQYGGHSDSPSSIYPGPEQPISQPTYSPLQTAGALAASDAGSSGIMAGIAPLFFPPDHWPNLVHQSFMSFMSPLSQQVVAGGFSEPIQDPAQDMSTGEPRGTSDAAAESSAPSNSPLVATHPSTVALPRPLPNRSSQGLYGCEVQDCIYETHLLSSWQRHMDKHDRPYKCTHPVCSRILGFTYQYGLKRHERQVHKLHQRPGDQQYCPHLDCRRSEGGKRPFGRKENLEDHIRRIHKTAQKLAIVNRPIAPNPAGRKRLRTESLQGRQEQKEELRREMKRLKENIEMLQKKLDADCG